MARKLTPKQVCHYVYALIDPRDDLPFYIGKGKGKRHAAHVVEWRSGKASNQRKANRIADIVGCGMEVGVKFLHKDIPEALALAHERAAIIRFRSEGVELTNLCSGTRHLLEISFAQVQGALGKFPTKERFRINKLYWDNREPTEEEYGFWLEHLRRLASLRKTIRHEMIREVGEEEAGRLAEMYGYPRGHSTRAVLPRDC